MDGPITMTNDAGETNRLLTEILLAIRGLDQNFKSQGERLDRLENIREPSEVLEESGFEHAHGPPLQPEVLSFVFSYKKVKNRCCCC